MAVHVVEDACTVELFRMGKQASCGVTLIGPVDNGGDQHMPGNHVMPIAWQRAPSSLLGVP